MLIAEPARAPLPECENCDIAGNAGSIPTMIRPIACRFPAVHGSRS